MEAEICLPYGDTYINLKNEGFNVLRPQMKHVWGTDENEKVIRAMQRPIASPPLESLASKAKTAVVIISDHTRPVPSKMILPNILKALRRGNPFIDITLLVATGCHRETKREELRQKLGDSILEKERIVIHDCDRSETVNLGCLPSGAILKINKLAAEADLLVSEGFIEPHLFAGFSGGRKSVLPGICSRLTVLANHCGTFINDKNARTGRLEGNPIHEDMTAAVKLSKLAYIVNVIIDEKKNIIAAFAGDPVRAHLEGCKVLAEMCRVKAVPADICITTNGGAPLIKSLSVDKGDDSGRADGTARRGNYHVCGVQRWNWKRHIVSIYKRMRISSERIRETLQKTAGGYFSRPMADPDLAADIIEI